MVNIILILITIVILLQTILIRYLRRDIRELYMFIDYLITIINTMLIKGGKNGHKEK